MPQVLPMQVAEPLVELQTVPQPPQLLVNARSASQPFAGLPSQSAQPALHEAMPHAPATH